MTIALSPTYATSVRSVPVRLIEAFAPAKPCNPDVRPPLVLFDDPRTLRSGRQHFRGTLSLREPCLGVII